MPTIAGAKPGSGKNFKAFVEKLKRQGYSEESAKAIAASKGMEKYGKKRMLQMAAAGRRRKAKKGSA